MFTIQLELNEKDIRNIENDLERLDNRMARITSDERLVVAEAAKDFWLMYLDLIDQIPSGALMPSYRKLKERYVASGRKFRRRKSGGLDVAKYIGAAKLTGVMREEFRRQLDEDPVIDSNDPISIGDPIDGGVVASQLSFDEFVGEYPRYVFNWIEQRTGIKFGELTPTLASAMMSRMIRIMADKVDAALLTAK